MILSEKIVTLRKRQGMSQEDLAEKLNVSRQTISRWENGTVVPDAYNILEISKAFGVTSDYLLNDDFETDDDIPQIKEVKKDNRILHLNLTRIAIMVQVAFLNVALQPFGATNGTDKSIEIIIKVVPILLASIWMTHNLKYEKDVKQYRRNVMIELAYCGVLALIFLFGYYSEMHSVGTVLLIVVALVYLLFINPKYMNRPFVKTLKK
ncbi:MAG: helix-turn-helix domain-containing protein [Lachnospiraceae bacterium]|nr:helix-turn-helix domain-containing protein [Lachnospiraceae bacterium]